MQIPITGPAYVNESQDVNYQRCVNMYLSEAGPNGRGNGPLLPTMGLSVLLSTSKTAMRGIWKIFNNVYAILDNSLYKLTINTNTKTITNSSIVGTLGTTSGLVKAAYDSLQIMFVDSSSTGYYYTFINSGTVNPGPIGGTALDTYTLIINGVTILNNLDVSSALSDANLVTYINTYTTSTGVTAVLDGSDITLSVVDDTSIVISESGTGFTSGTDGLTVSTGVFSTGTLSAFRTISDGDFLGGVDVVFSQGYFMYFQPNTADMYSSALNDANNYDAADVATAESRPDNLVGLAINKGELWALGTDTAEIWENVANPTGFPFSFKTGAAIDIGCQALGSIAYFNNSLMYLDSRGYIVQSATSDYLINTSSTYKLDIKSTIAMHAEFAKYQRLDDAVAFHFRDNGHLMYQINFPTAEKTWVYDATTNAWHERNYYDDYTQRFTYHLANFHCDFNGMNIVGSLQNGNIYLMSHDSRTDAGQPITRLRTFGPFNYEFNLVGVDDLIIRMQTGDVPTNGDGSDPYITLRYSWDGGHTWSYEMSKSIGQIGQYAKFINWPRLGTGREWILELKLVEPINFSIIDASALITSAENM